MDVREYPLGAMHTTAHVVGNDPDLVLTAGDRALFTRVASEIEKKSEEGDRRAMSHLNPEVATDNSSVSA